MTDRAAIHVTSHVGRDILSAAAAFKNEAAVVWEYVANSLQYVDSGIVPKVVVQIGQPQGRIVVRDNGRGMDAEGLRHFFKMHAENRDRLSGRSGRGKFGTGKSAAFGIARVLRIDTTRNGLRNVVVLTREEIESSTGENVPVQWDIRNERVSGPNGTCVSIEQLLLSRIRTPLVIEYIERHLPSFRAVTPEVAVNNHVCDIREPEIDRAVTFIPSDQQARVIGDIQLVVKVARAPLPEPEQGIAITAGIGNLVAVERCGMEAKEFGSYLFGEVDCLAIEESASPIAPYDSTRSLQLNPQHPVVQILLGFLGSKLEHVRTELVREAKEARKTETARRLDREAQRIAQILNDDYRSVSQRLRDIRSASSRPGAAGGEIGESQRAGSTEGGWVEGTDQVGVVSRTRGGGGSNSDGGRTAPDILRQGTKNPEGKELVDPSANNGARRPSASGGFSVEYKHLGRSEGRSRYDPAQLAILINLDHVVVAAALGDEAVEDTSFRRLSYEIAFSEYSIALGYELSKQDSSIPADDLLYEVRSSLNRVAGRAAPLYRASISRQGS